MNASLIPTVMLSLLLVFIILGFLIGWIRGFSKSLMRFFIVLGVTVLALFVVPVITRAALTADISKLNINIEGVQVVTLNELVIELLAKLPYLDELVASSPTIEAIINLAPQIIVNVILFILFFFLFKWVSMIFYWIFAGIFFSRKKMKDKDKHKFIGAVIGAVQGFIVVCVLLVPVFGMVETARPLVEAMRAENQEQAPGAGEGGEVDPNTFVYNAVTGEISGGDDNTNPSEPPAGAENGEANYEQALNNASKYLEVFDKTGVVKMFNFLHLSDLDVLMFDRLTTVKDKNLELNLRAEVKTIAKAYPSLKALEEKGVAGGKIDLNDETIFDDIKGAFNELYNSKVLSGIIEDLVPEMATRWRVNEPFMGINRPNFEDQDMNKLFTALLENLSTSQGANIRADVLTTVDLMKTCSKAGLLNVLTGGEANIIDIVTSEQNNGLIADIIDISLGSPTLKAVLPELINVAMNKVYVALNIQGVPEIIAPDSIDWEKEKVYLQNVFTEVCHIYKEISDGQAAGKDALSSLNFERLGTAFDNLRLSQLLGANSLQLMTKLLETDAIVGGTGNAELIRGFKEELAKIWTDTSVSLKSTFKSIQDTLVLAKDLANAAGDFNAENIGAIIENLASSDALKGVVNKVIEDDQIMGQLGLDEQTTKLVKETVSTVINFDYEAAGKNIQDDINAAVEIFDIANKVMSKGETDEVTLEAGEGTKLVETLASSGVILDTITKENSAVSGLNIGDAISETTRNEITEAIDANTTLTVDQQNALKALFAKTAA